jgi:hypothetical protein
MRPSANDVFPGPRLRDWALLAIGLGFVAMGVGLIPSHRDGAVAVIAFFGACALVAGRNVVRKLRYARMRPIRVEVAGGVRIRPSRTHAAGLSAAILVLGAVLVVFGRTIGVGFWICSWFIAAAGALLSLGVATGRIPVGYVRLDPPGITLGGRRYSYMIPWDRIARLAAGEFHDNPVLLIWIDRPQDVLVRPPELQARAQAALLRNLGWVGAHVMVMTAQYQMDLPLLLRAMERYVADPSSRAELARPRLGEPEPERSTRGPR